jgi:flap endonuclease-1
MLMEKGVRPCWVFDGKPPEAKKKTLADRKKKKEEAEVNKQEAEEDGDMEKVLKYAGMSVRVTPQMTSDAKELVRLLGLPVIEAPSEAEAQCAVLARDNKVYAVATEDMDCLTFGCPVLLRDFTNKDDPVIEIKLDQVLKGLNVTMEQFIDICILCGCDYADSIEGIGPIKAHKLIAEYENIEAVLKYVDNYNSDPKKKKKLSYDLDSFPYEECRKLFKEPEVTPSDKIDLKFNTPDYEGLKKFLVEGKGFAESRIESAMKRIESAKQKANQSRLDNFFKINPTGKRKVRILNIFLNFLKVDDEKDDKLTPEKKKKVTNTNSNTKPDVKSGKKGPSKQ